MALKSATIEFNPQSPPDFSKFRFCYATHVTVEWPSYPDHNNCTHWSTGKVGTNIKTKLPAAEYACGGSRVWLLADGSIEEDN